MPDAHCTTIPLKPSSDPKCGRYRRFSPLLRINKECAIYLPRETANENKHFKETKTNCTNWFKSRNFAFPFPSGYPVLSFDQDMRI